MGNRQETVAEAALTAEEAIRIDAYWRAANHLTVGQIYRLDNPPLRLEHVKAAAARQLGHAAIVSYIKSRWPEDLRRRHDGLNRSYAQRKSSSP